MSYLVLALLAINSLGITTNQLRWKTETGQYSLETSLANTFHVYGNVIKAINTGCSESGIFKYWGPRQLYITARERTKDFFSGTLLSANGITKEDRRVFYNVYLKCPHEPSNKKNEISAANRYNVAFAKFSVLLQNVLDP